MATLPGPSLATKRPKCVIRVSEKSLLRGAGPVGAVVTVRWMLSWICILDQTDDETWPQHVSLEEQPCAHAYNGTARLDCHVSQPFEAIMYLCFGSNFYIYGILAQIFGTKNGHEWVL